ncbi:Hypothetical protein PHPALM_8918 [Phytophthora palmivora]|uniref:Uncharacterized protein n=1 Tax=Phytophthora palmivora TaxID=4796 RepID=A0A2P4Y8P0_9STRA|nr:Hypothetical protein PHPALM_8918 [Phytophthora palmivora]
MPRTLSWKVIGGEVDTPNVMNKLRSYYTSKGFAMTCSVCTAAGHKIKWIYELGEHYDDHRSPKRTKLTQCQKAFCRKLVEERIRPQRIRNAMSRKFATAPLAMHPSLQRVQNLVNYYDRNHDRVKEVKEWIQACVCDGTEDENQIFTFSWENGNSGKPIVGDGGDATPFFMVC